MSGLLALLLVPSTALFFVAAWYVAFGVRNPSVGAGLFILVMALFFTAFALMTLTIAGPCDIRFDIGTRTYRFRRGLPLLSSELAGPISDFDYLYVRSLVYYRYGQRMPESRLYAVWKQAPKLYGLVPQPELLLQLVYILDPAWNQAVEIAGLLGLALEEGRRRPAKSSAGTESPPPTGRNLPEPAKQPAAPASRPRQPAPPETAADGRVVRVEGPLIDVRFDGRKLPQVYNAIAVLDPVWNRREIATVAQHLPDGIVRCVLHGLAAQALTGLEAVDTGVPDAAASPATLVAEAVASLGRDRIAGATLLETGLKAIDLLCPIPVGGRAAIFSPWGAGAMVLAPEMVQHVESRQAGLTLFTLLQLQADAPRLRESMNELPMRCGAVQTVYLRTDSPEDADHRARFPSLDSVIPLVRELARQGLYPPVDAHGARSRMTDEGRVSYEHAETARTVRDLLTRYRSTYPQIDAAGVEALPASERTWVSRARKLERYLTQPFHVAEPYTGIPGKSVPLTETIRGCRAILEGACDALPEHGFYMIGTIDDVRG